MVQNDKFLTPDTYGKALLTEIRPSKIRDRQATQCHLYKLFKVSHVQGTVGRAFGVSGMILLRPCALVYLAREIEVADPLINRDRIKFQQSKLSRIE